MRRKDREITDMNEMMEIIEKADVCRLALSDNNIPYIVTLNFGLVSGEPLTLYFHSANEGKKLDILLKNNLVCFEFDIDHCLDKSDTAACNWGMNYRSVVGMGTGEIVAGEDEKVKGLNAIMQHYSGRDSFAYDAKHLASTTVFKVAVTEMCGKKRTFY